MAKFLVASSALLLLLLVGQVHAFVIHRSIQSSSRTQSLHAWKFQGHDVYTESFKPSPLSTISNPFASLLNNPQNSKRDQKPILVLIHGFGCSTTYWRKTKTALLDAGYEVHALDLLGQGQSSKPGRSNGIEYSIRLWAQQVDTYIQEIIDDGSNSNNNAPIVLCGNSLGSLVALTAVTGDFDDSSSSTATNNNNYQGICMFNCGVGFNSRGIANEEQWAPWQRFLINAVYNVLELLIFRNTLLLTYVLNNVVTKDLLRDTLQSLYKCTPSNVDDELVDSFYYPAKEEGSVEALSQIYTNDPGATPMELHRRYQDMFSTTASSNSKAFPVHLVWGDDDAVTPLEGGVGQFYCNLAQDPTKRISFETLSPSGHIPFDDNPDASNQSLLTWLGTL